MTILPSVRAKAATPGGKLICFGTTVRPLCEQLGCDPREVASLQYYADAVLRLGINEILTPSEVRKAEERIVKRIPERLLKEVTE